MGCYYDYTVTDRLINGITSDTLGHGYLTDKKCASIEKEFIFPLLFFLFVLLLAPDKEHSRVTPQSIRFSILRPRPAM